MNDSFILPDTIESLSLADRLVAHRGYASRYPENSLLAVERALHHGARFIEVDIQLTADAQPVLYHDRDMKRLSGAENAVHLLTYDELNRYSLHNPVVFGDRFADEPIAHLQQLINLMLMHPRVTFFIEFKRVALENFGLEQTLKATLPLLELVRHQAVLISYSEGMVKAAAEQGWRTGMVMDHFPERDWHSRFPVSPEFLFLDYNDIGTRIIQEEKQHWPGISLALFEVTDAVDAQSWLLQGADLVETFAIGAARKAMQSVAQI